MREACLNVETKVSLRSGFTCRIAASSINWFSPLDPKCNLGSFSGLYSAELQPSLRENIVNSLCWIARAVLHIVLHTVREAARTVHPTLPFLNIIVLVCPS
jgi:hypothetical protein